MAKLEGAFVSLDFDRYETFSWTDQKGNVKPIQSLVGLVSYGDGTRNWLKVGFPRDEHFQPPKLIQHERYIVPVIASVDKKRGEVRWTMRTDILPFKAPEIS